MFFSILVFSCKSLKTKYNSLKLTLSNLGLFKNKPAPTKPARAMPIWPTEGSTEAFRYGVGSPFPLPTSAGPVIGCKICTPKRNRTDRYFIYIYIHVCVCFTWLNDSRLLPGFFFFFFLGIETSATWFWKRRHVIVSGFILYYNIIYFNNTVWF